MTIEEFNKLIPRKSLIEAEVDGVKQICLLKFLICRDGEYTLLLTTDLSNPEPTKILDTDWECCYNQCKYLGTCSLEFY